MGSARAPILHTQPISARWPWMVEGLTTTAIETDEAESTKLISA